MKTPPIRHVARLLVILALFLATAASYKDLPMQECAWCHHKGRLAFLNRHHVTPQNVAPDLRNDPANIRVLCRRCHLVLGHRNDWHRYNPDLAIILANYTNSLPCLPK